MIEHFATLFFAWASGSALASHRPRHTPVALATCLTMIAGFSLALLQTTFPGANEHADAPHLRVLWLLGVALTMAWPWALALMARIVFVGDEAVRPHVVGWIASTLLCVPCAEISREMLGLAHVATWAVCLAYGCVALVQWRKRNRDAWGATEVCAVLALGELGTDLAGFIVWGDPWTYWRWSQYVGTVLLSAQTAVQVFALWTSGRMSRSDSARS